MAAKAVAIKPAPRHQSAFVAQCSVPACQRIRSKKKRRHEEPDRKRDQHRLQRVAHREAQKFAAALARELISNLTVFRFLTTGTLPNRSEGRASNPAPFHFISHRLVALHWLARCVRFAVRLPHIHRPTVLYPLWFRQASIRSPLSALPASAA